MAFSVKQYDKGQTAPIEYVPGKTGEEFAVGEALTVTAGAATKCGATARPMYIAVGAANAGGVVPCVRVAADIVYSAPLSAAGTALKIGDKVTLGADGLTVTATTASGVAELAAMDGTAVGDLVHVRF